MSLQRWLVGFFLLLFCGCTTHGPFVQSLPESQLLAPLADSELFAVSYDGDMIAYVADGLNLLRLSDRYQQRLTYDSPQALIWTADGSALVAAFREAEKTRLVLLGSSPDDRPQVFVDEQISDLAWLADGRLLALAQQVDTDSGLLQLEVSLLIWDGQRDVEKIPLYRQSFESPARYDPPFQHHFDLSPLKDELVYNRYLELPTAGSRAELVLYNLLTGRELVLANSDSRSNEGYCAADGESFLLPAGMGVVQLFNPWTENVELVWTSAVEELQIAPGRDLFYLAGKLYERDQLLLQVPVAGRVRFSADGARMFVAWQRKLYLYSGYPVPETIEYSPLEKVNLQRIRQQRSRGEISVREYYQRRNNVLNP